MIDKIEEIIDNSLENIDICLENNDNSLDHIGVLEEINGNTLKKKKIYFCNVCNIKTDDKYNYERHLLTAKHIKKIKYFNNGNDKALYYCLCGKSYIHRQSLSIHKKKCKPAPEPEHIYLTNSPILENDIVKELIKQNQSILLENQEFKKMMMEMVSKPFNINSNNITNSHNKQFNLQFFLNNTCKNAMNMSDFMDSLEIKSSELEDMGKLGYVKGLSNIFIRALKELDEKDRPMHCTDIKRETLYIKDNNVWEKETDDKMKLKKIIIYIADKNFRRIPKWKLDNPKSEDIMSKKHLDYIMMLSQVMSGISLEDENGTNKIIRNVANEICLNKKVHVEVL